MLIALLIVNVATLGLLLGLIWYGSRRNNDRKTAEELRRELQEGFSAQRTETNRNFGMQSELLHKSFTDYMKFLMEFREGVSKAEQSSAEKISGTLQDQGDRSARKFTELANAVEEKISGFQKALTEENRNFRKEQLEFQTAFQTGQNRQMEQNRQLMDERLKEIRSENSTKLDEMKKTVDEKLQSSIEKHFNESFKLISERLEQVHKGLGEMQTLAAGVGDLKKVLTNVKTRGNIGEIQLSTILEQYLAPDQYAANVVTVPGSSELVEYAVKMPGKQGEAPVYLPIDSKFPVEDYQRLLECCENNPALSPEVKHARDAFAKTVKKCAEEIRRKYISPPNTTSFGMMFVPSEGIYAEILRLPGLFEQLQNECKISVVGPSNLVAFLNALQMGFRTLAIEKRSHEVWNILGAVKTEFRKFGEEMESTQKSLQAVCNHVEKIGTRSRAMERKLRDVQELPQEESERLLSDAPESDE